MLDSRTSSNSGSHSCIKFSMSGNLCVWIGKAPFVSWCNLRIFSIQSSMSFESLTSFTFADANVEDAGLEEDPPSVTGSRVEMGSSLVSALNRRAKRDGSDCLVALGSSRTSSPRPSSSPSGRGTFEVSEKKADRS